MSRISSSFASSPARLRGGAARARAHRGAALAHAVVVCLTVLLCRADFRSLRSQEADFCSPAESITGAAASRIASTPAGAVGESALLEDGVTDLSWGITEGGNPAITALDPEDFDGWTSFDPELGGVQRGRIPWESDALPFGLAWSAHGETAGNFLVLDPGLPVDPQSTTTRPAIAVVAPDGTVLRDFVEISGDTLDPRAILSSIDVHPRGDEIVVAGSNGAVFRTDIEVYFLNDAFEVVRGPFRPFGRPILNHRTGICYNSCDTLLVLSTLRNNFEASLLVEYDAVGVELTGRGMLLDELSAGGLPPAPVGLDLGFVDGREALYTYNSIDDALHALELEYIEFPGLALDAQCERSGGRRGALRLTWGTNPLAVFDESVVSQNGVEVARLPAGVFEFVPGEFMTDGYSEFSIGLRREGTASPRTSFCVDVNTARPRFSRPGQEGIFAALPERQDPLNPGGDPDIYDPLGQPAFLGLDATSVVERGEDFRLFVLETASPRVLHVFDLNWTLLGDEEITLEQGLEVERLTGVAILEAGEGPGEDRRFAVLGRNLVGEPAAAIYRSDGSLVHEIPRIDLSAVGGGESDPVLVDWDTDAAGRFVAIDHPGARLLLIEFDPDAPSLRAVDEAPVPVCQIADCSSDRVPPLGGITVLPNGLYLVSSGGPLDRTVTRAFLTTAFDEDPARSVRFTGRIQGLLPYSFFRIVLPEKFGGVGIGPQLAYGLAASFVRTTDVSTGEPIEEEVSYYSVPSLPPSLRPVGFFDDAEGATLLVHATGAGSHPERAAVQLANVRLGSGDTTGELTPEFVDLTGIRDFYYVIVNRGDDEVAVDVSVSLDGARRSEFDESLRMPAGRFVNRSLRDRGEGRIEIGLAGGFEGADVQVIVGARALISDAEPTRFRRGDTDGNGTLEITDPINNLAFQFLGTFAPPCLDALDFDDNGTIEISDPIGNLSHQFLGQAPAPPPGSESCGTDPTPDSGAGGDDLGCESPPADCASN